MVELSSLNQMFGFPVSSEWIELRSDVERFTEGWTVLQTPRPSVKYTLWEGSKSKHLWRYKYMLYFLHKILYGVHSLVDGGGLPYHFCNPMHRPWSSNYTLSGIFSGKGFQWKFQAISLHINPWVLAAVHILAAFLVVIHQTRHWSSHKRAIVLFNRNLPTRCYKTSLRAFISWIAGMAVSDHWYQESCDM